MGNSPGPPSHFLPLPSALPALHKVPYLQRDTPVVPQWPRSCTFSRSDSATFLCQKAQHGDSHPLVQGQAPTLSTNKHKTLQSGCAAASHWRVTQTTCWFALYLMWRVSSYSHTRNLQSQVKAQSMNSLLCPGDAQRDSYCHSLYLYPLNKPHTEPQYFETDGKCEILHFQASNTKSDLEPGR